MDDAPIEELLGPDLLARLRALPPDRQRSLVFVARNQLHAISLELNGHDYDAVSALIHAASFAAQSDHLASESRLAPADARAGIEAGIRRWIEDVNHLLVGSAGPSSIAVDGRQREALVDWLQTVARQVKNDGRDVDLATDNAIRSWRIHTTAERHGLAEKNRHLVRQAIVAMSNSGGRGKLAETTAPEARELLFDALGLSADDDTAARTKRRRRQTPRK